MTLFLHLAFALAFHLGQPFTLKLDSLKAPHVASIRATLTSNCDNEIVIDSNSSYRSNGDYYVTFTVPESAGPCDYDLSIVYWLQDDESEDPRDMTTDVKVKLSR